MTDGVIGWRVPEPQPVHVFYGGPCDGQPVDLFGSLLPSRIGHPNWIGGEYRWDGSRYRWVQG